MLTVPLLIAWYAAPAVVLPSEAEVPPSEGAETVEPAVSVESPVEPAPSIEPVQPAQDDERPGPALGPPPAPASAPAPAPAGLRLPGHYIHVAPGLLTFNALDPRFQWYTWGISGGRYVLRGQRFAAQLGGFFEHLAGVRAASSNLLRFGGEFRLGASTERVFGYALVRTGLDVAAFHKDVAAIEGQRAALFFILSLGAGVQGALGPRLRLILGAEPSFDFTWPGVLILFRTRAFVGWRFG